MKKNMIIRLDDASEKMNKDNWEKIEKILDEYNVKPIVGIIPLNEDPDFQKYSKIDGFYDMVKKWEKKDWHIAMHGYKHVFDSDDGGINPVNNKSEFAGLSLNIQCEKIKNGYEILTRNGIYPKIFFAPGHTFDENTIGALRQETNIRIISDTIANDVYLKDGFYFIPQQSGKVRNLPFKVVTFCYHPNNMKEKDFNNLENFLKDNSKYFKMANLKNRKLGLYDRILRFIYFLRRK